MKFLYFFLLSLLVSCNDAARIHTIQNTGKQQKGASGSRVFINEQYIDSTRIGLKGKNKIEFKRIVAEDSVYADIRLYGLKDDGWKPLQHLTYPKDLVTSCSPIVADYNNDGFNDLSYTSATAARGANDIRTLFIYDKATGLLRLMKNSEEFPNPQYNPELDCIDAFAVYGGSTSYFLRIEKDSLRPFARVDLFEGYREVYRYDDSGKDRLIKRERFETSYLRYKNFDPLEEYQEF
jgi:hypothetical protein